MKKRGLESKFTYNKLNDDLHDFLTNYLDEKSKHNLWITNKKRISKIPMAAFSYFAKEAKKLTFEIENREIGLENTVEKFTHYVELTTDFDAYICNMNDALLDGNDSKLHALALECFSQMISPINPLLATSRPNHFEGQSLMNFFIASILHRRIFRFLKKLLAKLLFWLIALNLSEYISLIQAMIAILS